MYKKDSNIEYLPDDYDENKMLKNFEESYEILRETNQTFTEKMVKIFAYRKINKASDFTELTDLHKKHYYDFKRNGYIPKMSTFMSMCMGLNLDLAAAESLLSSLSLGFDKTNKLDCAYIYLISHYQGLCIEDCNKILSQMGFTDSKYLLGTTTHFDK